MMNISKRKKSSCSKLKGFDNHDEFLNRITKTLYYAKLPTESLSLPVTEFAAELFTEVRRGGSLERLEVEDASRISRNACVSPCSLVLALLYLERLKDCNPEYLQQVAPSELFLVSLMVASKFLHDNGEEDEVFNDEWARFGDLTLQQMNRLEQEFLGAINWSVFVHNQEFWDKLQRLERHITYKEAQKRGWFSYTDLSCHLDTVQLLPVVQTLLNVYSVCVATYTAGIVMLLGSALISSHLPGSVFVPNREVSRVNESYQENNVNTMDSFANLGNSSCVDELFLESDEKNFLNFSNVSCSNCEIFKTTNNESTQNADWWLNPMLTWLPKYSGLFEADEKFKHARAFVTRSEFDDVFMRDRGKLATRINWRETLGLTLKFPFYDWRYYLSSISRISISHRF